MYWSWWIQTFFLEIFYWRLSLDVSAGVSLTATALQAELCVCAVGLGACWTPWVTGGARSQQQLPREVPGQPGVSAGIWVLSEQMPELCLSLNIDSKEVIWILPLALNS